MFHLKKLHPRILLLAFDNLFFLLAYKPMGIGPHKVYPNTEIGTNKEFKIDDKWFYLTPLACEYEFFKAFLFERAN